MTNSKSRMQPQIVALLFLGATAWAVAAHAAYDKIYVFGDSDSDTGRRFSLEGLPSGVYYQGRHSNGPVAIEQLALDLGLTVDPYTSVNPTGTNFAVGGSLTANGNVDTSHGNVLQDTGMLDQFNTFLTTLGASNPADANALYFIWGGGNDLSECGPNCTPAQIQQVVTNLDTLVNDLHNVGAQHFFVVNQYGAAKAGNTDDVSFNALLLQDMTSLLSGPEITVFDAAAVVKQLDTPGNQWGFTEGLGSACYAGGSLAGAVSGGATLCSTPKNYVQWDSNGHLTASANQVLGDAMYGALPVPEPSLIALAGLGLGGLAAFPKHRRSNRGRDSCVR